MGFCRRCGDIVSGARCKCGGTPVAPVVSWNHGNDQNDNADPWLRTYLSRDKSPTRSSPTTSLPTNTTDPVKRFPRPQSRSGTPPQPNNLGHRASAHIALTTSQLTRPSSPLKQSVVAPEADILPSLSPHDKSLSKVYGSVLQTPDSLSTHCCAICASVFPPDATIYPDPTSSDEQRFLCRPCFTTNGGSKGTCPTCARPVLALKSEGGFIEVDQRYWHKRCFNCEGCFKNIGGAPMVDVLGRPSCTDCFDNCFKRDRTPKKRESVNANSASPTHLGSESKSREGSPTILELEQRLGITRSRESSPTVAASRIGSNSRSSGSVSAKNSPSSPISPPASFPRPRASAIEPTSPTPRGKFERFRGANIARRSVDLKSPPSSPTRTSTVKPTAMAEDIKKAPNSPPSPLSSSNDYKRSLFSPSPSTPELVSDFSDTATMSSLNLESPLLNASEPTRNTNAKSRLFDSMDQDIAERKALSRPTFANSTRPLATSTRPLSNSASTPAAVVEHSNVNCAKCHRRLFSIASTGRYVTVPDSNGILETYHQNCFKCSVCSLPFKEASQGQAIFVRGQHGPSHLECSPPERSHRTSVGSSPSPSPVRQPANPTSPTTSPSRKSPAVSYSPKESSSSPRPQQSSRYQRPQSTVFTNSAPRFGGSISCLGCRQSVSAMERGVVPGPQGSRWHATCLVCGGKPTTPGTPAFSRGRQAKKHGEPGCGKKLDSAAKSDGDGNVWCRDCLLLLSSASRGSPSPTRPPLVPSHTGTQQVLPQLTGTTTLARQFTGMGAGNDGSLLRHLTGGGANPTRSISPTKQLGHRPRPRSVVGSRSKSIDEGRGMFLVRQLTGTTGKD